MSELAVDYGQGYAFDQPKPLETVLEELAQVQEPRAEFDMQF